MPLLRANDVMRNMSSVLCVSVEAWVQRDYLKFFRKLELLITLVYKHVESRKLITAASSNDDDGSRR